MKKWVPLSITFGLVALFPISLLTLGFGLPAQFGETYYGELAIMKKNLYESKKKKIVFIGNSAVAFGVRSDLLAKEFPDYDVVNFGLYGAVGTKSMLDWSKKAIGEGDIVVLLPEPYQQTSSLYFSAKDVWRAADGDFSLLGGHSSDEKKALVGTFFNYVGEKFEFLTGQKKISADGAYSRKAFENAEGGYETYMTFDRPYNVMSGGYDSVNLPILDSSVYGAGFLDYLNEYASYCKGKGASTYFGFAPVDSLSLSDNAYDQADALYDYLDDNLEFPLLTHPAKYFLDYRYFYDNNVHMNSAGAYIFSDLLAEDLKLTLGIREPNSIELPDPPEIPAEDYQDGDNSDAACFLYEKKESPTGSYIAITGLSEEGKSRNELTVPSSYEDLPVREFSADTFAGNQLIARIVLPSTIRTIYDRSFYGCTKLVALYFQHDSILGLNVGLDFLEGAPNCYIYLKTGVSVADCAGGWERYMSRIRYY